MFSLVDAVSNRANLLGGLVTGVCTPHTSAVGICECCQLSNLSSFHYIHQ